MKFRKPIKKKNKTSRRPYTGSKRFDATCRNHGACPYCSNGRQHFDRKRRAGWLADLLDWLS